MYELFMNIRVFSSHFFRKKLKKSKSCFSKRNKKKHVQKRNIFSYKISKNTCFFEEFMV